MLSYQYNNLLNLIFLLDLAEKIEEETLPCTRTNAFILLKSGKSFN